MIRKAEERDIDTVVELALQLWPGHERAELEAEINGLLQTREAAFFLAFEGGVAFLSAVWQVLIVSVFPLKYTVLVKDNQHLYAYWEEAF